MSIPNEEEIAHEQWSRPLLSMQNSKSRRSFHKQFRVPEGDPPPVNIEVQHCMDRSILSSYSKAALLDTGVKTKAKGRIGGGR